MTRIVTWTLVAGLLIGGLLLIETLARAGSIEGLRYVSCGLLVLAVIAMVKK